MSGCAETTKRKGKAMSNEPKVKRSKSPNMATATPVVEQEKTADSPVVAETADVPAVVPAPAPAPAPAVSPAKPENNKPHVWGGVGVR